VTSSTAAPDPRRGIDDLLEASLLVVDGREILGRDLLAAGVVSGRWPQLEQEIADGLGLVAVAAPADAEVNGVVRDFRFERNLLSAEDLRAWMGTRGLTLAGVKGVAARSLARAAGGTPEAVPPSSVALALPAELICTGALREIGFWLADRLLSAATTRDGEVDALPLESPAVQRLVFAEARTVAGGALPERGVERAGRLARIAALDEAHCEWEAAGIGTPELTRRLHEKELEWARYELDELALASPGAAAEAARQLAEGTPADQVADAAGVPLQRRAIMLVDAQPELARMLAGAVAGDVAGPWDEGTAHVVSHVRDRCTPELTDEPSVARARADLLAEMQTRLRAGRVRWYDRS
jgi:hypothetical protein